MTQPLYPISLLLAISLAPRIVGAELSPALSSWLAAQTKIQTWSADFVQTRTLKSLAQPLSSPGHIWFATPDRLRWELGSPPQTIVLKVGSELLITYPKLKRVEHFPLTGEATGPWRDALNLLQATFPRSESELQSQYTIISQIVHDQTCEVVLQPKSINARQMIPEFRISFDTQDSSLRWTQLKFGDGSILRNDFKQQVVNPKLDEAMFQPAIPADYKSVEPLKK
jgi:outer membrane lipoprotein-sorting protein